MSREREKQGRDKESLPYILSYQTCLANHENDFLVMDELWFIELDNWGSRSRVMPVSCVFG